MICIQLLRSCIQGTEFCVILRREPLFFTEEMHLYFLRSSITCIISTSAHLLCQKEKDPCHDKSEAGIPWPHGSSHSDRRNVLVKEDCTITCEHTTNHILISQIYECCHDQPIWQLPSILKHLGLECRNEKT